MKDENEVPEAEREELSAYLHLHAKSVFLVIPLRLGLKSCKKHARTILPDDRLPAEDEKIEATWISYQADRIIWEADPHKYR